MDDERDRNCEPSRQSSGRHPVAIRSCQRQTIDVDNFLRRLDVQLHQIDQRRSAGDETNVGSLLRRGRFRRRGNGLRRSSALDEFESFMPVSPYSRLAAHSESPPRCSDTRRNGKCCRS